MYTERVDSAPPQPGSVPEVAWLDENELVSDETAPWIKDNDQSVSGVRYLRVKRESPDVDTSIDHTQHATFVGDVLNAYHTTRFAREILDTKVLLSVFNQDESGIVSVNQNIATHPGYPFHFTAEISNRIFLRDGHGVPLLDTRGNPNFHTFVLVPESVENLALAQTTGKFDEGVATRLLTKTVTQLREDPRFAFLQETDLVTGIPIKELMAVIPLTETLQTQSLRLATEIVFGYSETRLAQEVRQILTQLNREHPIRFFNGHGDPDRYLTLALLMSHGLMRSYWLRYGEGLKTMVRDTDAKANSWARDVLSPGKALSDEEWKYLVSCIWSQMGTQFSSPALKTDWLRHYQVLEHEGLLFPEDQLDSQFAQNWFMDERNVLNLIKVLAGVNPYTSKCYLKSEGDRKYYPYIPYGMLASFVDFHNLAVDEQTRLIDWNSASNLSAKTMWVMYADSFSADSKTGKCYGRFQPLRSRNYPWYASHWKNANDDI